jgi:MFS family permease
MNLTTKISNRNLYSFLWHALFLAFAQNFLDVDTIIPAMIIEAGGGAVHVGIMTAIMMGGSSFSQLFFAPFVSNAPFKKKFLLLGINLRIVSLFGLAIILYFFITQNHSNVLWIIFLFISMFSFSGAFTNISYIDIMGKSIDQTKRKTFFSSKQIIGGVIVLLSAFLVKKILTHFNYPSNYATMFLIGGTALLVASAGFWNIIETESSGIKMFGVKYFLHQMLDEIKNNKKLIYFLGFINTQGIVISFMPFVILYAKKSFQTQGSDIGLFLLFKVLGVVAVSLLVLLANKKIKYNVLLYSNVILSLLLVVSIMLINDASALKYVFILGGITLSIYTISMNGVLLEISNKKNRALYVGFAGAGNIVPAIFPLIAGGIINKLGYSVFFILFILIVSFSFFFIYNLNCKK